MIIVIIRLYDFLNSSTVSRKRLAYAIVDRDFRFKTRNISNIGAYAVDRHFFLLLVKFKKLIEKNKSQ